MADNRWQYFRDLDESIPSTPREAAIFIDNAWHHMLASEYSCHEGRKIVLAAHARINESFVDDTMAILRAKEVA